MPSPQPRRKARKRLSTTVSLDTLAYLDDLVRTSKAQNIGKALDFAIARLLRAEGRVRLERETAAYFQKLSPEQIREENLLGDALAKLAEEINFDD